MNNNIKNIENLILNYKEQFFYYNDKIIKENSIKNRNNFVMIVSLLPFFKKNNIFKQIIRCSIIYKTSSYLLLPELKLDYIKRNDKNFIRKKEIENYQKNLLKIEKMNQNLNNHFKD